jgi:predicted PurR-regulated permease PerM
MGVRVGALVLAATTIAGVVVCVLLAAPFLGALTWALALAILFAPLHARIEATLKRPNLAAMVSVLMVALVVAIPAAFVVERLVEEAATSAALVQAKVASGAVQRLIDAHPSIAPIGQWIEQQIDLPAMMASLATWLSNVGASFARGSVAQVIEVVLTFYLLYYFLRDRHAAGRLLRDWLPLTHAETERLFDRVVHTVHATIYGTLAVAAVQGTLGGLMFWFLGLPTPLLWGLVMGLLSIVPVLGAFVVWMPAAALLALDGSWGKAVILAMWGAVVVGGIDNILRPMFVGNRLKLHTVPAFISMIGGLILFGASGFILGPLVVSVTILLVEIWGSRDQTGHPKVLG